MSTVPTPVPVPSPARPGLRGWLDNHPRLRAAAAAALVAALSALATRYGIDPRVIETTIEVFKETPAGAEPVKAQPGPIDYEGMRFHGDHGDHDAAHGAPLQAQPARWPADRITYGIDYPGARGLNPPLSDDAIRAALKQAANWWNENLLIELVEVPFSESPQIPIRFEAIDGPGGVLAEAFLADGTARPKPLRFDRGERWTAGPPAANLVSLPTVACHELGHSLGLGHDAANAPAVMRPTYTSALPREQARDVQRMVGLGYRPRPAVPPAPTDVLTFPIQARTADVVEALKRAGYEVKKP